MLQCLFTDRIRVDVEYQKTKVEIKSTKDTLPLLQCLFTDRIRVDVEY